MAPVITPRILGLDSADRARLEALAAGHDRGVELVAMVLIRAEPGRREQEQQWP